MDSRADTCAIRRAVAADAALLSTLGMTTFREAFSHLYAAEDIETFLVKAHAATYYERLLRDPDVAIWLATPPGEEPIGYIVVGICQLPVPDLEPRAGEIRRLYVRTTGQSSGIGTKLLRTSLDWLASGTFSPLYVGVWSANYGAQRLYQRYGFVKIGEYEFSVGKQRDREFIFRQPGA
ncbi:MAG TPA: GNAT family N-acetyltransferase [Steroidobacteraceae bacterium]|nr:GNAT family N-acetyltransferase [Steroidobacteraceae bacterium]